MDRETFGRLVQVLRREHRDEEDRLWTQETLAHKTKLSKRTIERIEDGSLIKIDAPILQRLADALKLTTMERKEFFFAAIGITNNLLTSSKSNSTEVLDALSDILKRTTLPAFINDVYADIVAANHSIINLLEIPRELIIEASHVQAGYNTMRIIFSQEFGFRDIIGDQWDKSARHNMQYFKGISLRYRLNPYFEDILSALRKYPAFKRYWGQAHIDEEDTSGNNVCYQYKHRTFGNLSYLANISTSFTKSGELYSVIYIPLDPHTSKVFKEISEKHGNDIMKLAPWPKAE
jgi:transcriptional regulator with XRE-family HTH domain